MTFSIIYWIYSNLDGIHSSLDRIHSRPIPLIFSVDSNHSRLEWLLSTLNHQMMVIVIILGSEIDKNIIPSDSNSQLWTWILGYGLIAEYQNTLDGILSTLEWFQSTLDRKQSRLDSIHSIAGKHILAKNQDFFFVVSSQKLKLYITFTSLINAKTC